MIYAHVFTPVAVLARTGLFFLPDFVIGNIVHNTVFNTPSRDQIYHCYGNCTTLDCCTFPMCLRQELRNLFYNLFSQLLHCIPIPSYQTTTLFACLLLRRPSFDVLTLFRAGFKRTTLFAALISC